MGTIVGAYGVSHTGMMIRKYAAGTPAHERVYAAFARVPLTPMSRSVALGAALREAIDARPQDERVVLLATGGLSHWVATPRMGEINEEFDRWFLEQVR